MKKTNIILIGMPGAGKSTIGVILAKRIGYHFIDTDLIIQAQQHCRLQDIINRQGLADFRKIEEQVLANTQAQNSVIATGGSAIYCKKGLATLAKSGYQIYLNVSLDSLRHRIADMGQRGLVMEKGQNFEQLYRERTPLYEQVADLTIDADNLNAEQVAISIEEEIIRSFSEFKYL